METSSATNLHDRRGQQPGLGERLSSWIRTGELRELTAEMLDDLDIVHTDELLTEFDDRIEESRRSFRRARRQLFLASYPWLVITPFVFLVALRSRAAMKRRPGERSEPEMRSNR